MRDVAIRVATDDDVEAMLRLNGLAFGSMWPPEHHDAARELLDLDRFRLAYDGAHLVGVAGVYTQEVTVPGGAQVGHGGVTGVAVAPTHRRRGILRMLMHAVHRDVDERGEPLAMLGASEGGIYERFGYGVASHVRVIEIDRRRTQVRPERRPAPGTVHPVEPDDPRIDEIFDRYRRRRVGEINRTPAAERLFRMDEGAGLTGAIHRDGFALWKLEAKWNRGHPAHELTLHDVVAATPEAHAALWHTVLSVDLVGPISAYRAASVDDALPYLLTDPRALRTVELNDGLWINVRDVGRALAARTYGTDDEFVLDVDLGDDGNQRWKIAGGPDGAAARRARSRPDLALDRASLGAIYLGGVRPSTLARAGRLVARNEAVLRRADAFFQAERLPHCSTGF